MANEHTISSIADLFASEVLANEFLLTLAPRDGAPLSHPCIQRVTAAPGSNVVKVPHIGYGADLMTAATEASEHANTQLTDTHTDITLAMYALRRNVGDFAKIVSNPRLGIQAFAQELAIAYQQTAISLVAALAPSFTATAGPGTGSDLTWATFLPAKGTLGAADADGPLMALLHPQQWADLEADALSLGFAPSIAGNADVVNVGLQSYKGRWFGIDIFTSSHIGTVNAGADRSGMLIAPGAVAVASASFVDDPDPNIANLGMARLERVRQGEQFTTSYVQSMVFGTALCQDSAGVEIISDA